MMAFTREPFRRRASTIGCASPTRRLTCETILSTVCIRDDAESRQGAILNSGRQRNALISPWDVGQWFGVAAFRNAICETEYGDHGNFHNHKKVHEVGRDHDRGRKGSGLGP